MPSRPAGSRNAPSAKRASSTTRIFSGPKTPPSGWRSPIGNAGGTSNGSDHGETARRQSGPDYGRGQRYREGIGAPLLGGRGRRRGRGSRRQRRTGDSRLGEGRRRSGG